MRLLTSENCVIGRLLRMVTVILFCSFVAGTTAQAEDFGVVSANAADRPPVMNPDIASRSSDPNLPPAYGPKDAKVLIVIFSDYQCPSCRRITQATHQISAEFPGEVRVELWHHALAMHRNAQLAAAAAVAAQRQGHFWGMHDRIFQNQNSLDVTTLEQHAQALGLDLAKFRADMSDPAVIERIRQEGVLADALGARATPGFLINGKVSVGWGSWMGFRAKVERELAAASVLAEQGMNSIEIRTQRAIDNFQDSEEFDLYRKAFLQPNITPAGG